MKKIFTIIFLTALTIGLSTGHAFASPKVQEIDIDTAPEKVLFDISNFKPGDWAERSITIQNRGKEDFNYLTSINFKGGSKRYYNELILKISNKNSVLFEGKLKDFKKLKPRFLASHHYEQLLFRIDVPGAWGNEMQGLGCEVELKFSADGTAVGSLPAGGSQLPETGTNMYNLIILGGSLFFLGAVLQVGIFLKKKSSKTIETKH